MRCSSKKGFQLSVNVLVVIIMGVVLLGAGITLVTKLVSQGEEYSAEVDDRLKEQLRKTQFADGRTSAVLNPHQVIDSDDGGYFLVGFVNKLGSTHKFNLTVVLSGNSTPLNDHQKVSAEKAPLSSRSAVELAPNEDAFRYVKVVLPKGMPTGEYLYDVYVCHNATRGEQGECPSDYYMYQDRKHRLFVTFEG